MWAQPMDSKWTTGGGVVRVVDGRSKPIKETVSGGSDRVVDRRQPEGNHNDGHLPLQWTGNGSPIRIPISVQDWWNNRAEPWLYYHEQRFYIFLGEVLKRLFKKRP